ncbi:hypothetical protein MPC4_250067 [Methylocella tundrae]|uniref:Uncharacterized protein n=1 Tax=Methylocella tundrae TaxID=227605 RepID=A0A8B6M696_METTU|nr:hypothetical protein MPC1_1620007 [Methylocella tundrae]VTZ50559.1 hypothetical protein MPC4_250067 [Methylocella tundrae]
MSGVLRLTPLFEINESRSYYPVRSFQSGAHIFAGTAAQVTLLTVCSRPTGDGNNGSTADVIVSRNNRNNNYIGVPSFILSGAPKPPPCRTKLGTRLGGI